ncbi:MAG TPA: DUF835 domain-containing protein [Thermoplasmata archaeon]
MRSSFRAALAVLCFAAVAASVLASTPSVSGDEEVEVVFDFSPMQASYLPGQNFSVIFTVRNLLADMSEYGYPNDIKVTALSAHFSWMAPNVWETEDVGATSDWLLPGDLQTYPMNMSVPTNITAGTYSYLLKVEYRWLNAWGESVPTPWASITYRDLVVASESTEDGTVAAEPDYLPAAIAGIAIVLAVGAIGAVLYHTRKGPREKEAPVNGAAAAVAAELQSKTTTYPVIHAIPGEHFPIEKGSIYLVKEKRPNIAFGMFKEAVSHEAQGMLVVREHPNRLKQQHEFTAAKILWLTRRAGMDHIDPQRLSLLSLEISRFVEGAPRSVVLLEGIEYIITQNDFEAVLRFVNHLHDFVFAFDCAIIIVIDPRVLSTRELALLERSAKIVETMDAAEQRADRLSDALEA